MTTHPDDLRTDTVSRIILAAPRELYRAHLDAEKLTSFRTPQGMTARLLAFEGRLGGGYRMELNYPATETAQGKSAVGLDRFAVTFDELIPDEKIVETIRFETDDPAFAAPMILTTTLRPVRDGTKVTVEAAQVPLAILQSDHLNGLEGALRYLALLTE
jgi:uncharacterized protein YndB with AHSA1/START domain